MKASCAAERTRRRELAVVAFPLDAGFDQRGGQRLAFRDGRAIDDAAALLAARQLDGAPPFVSRIGVLLDREVASAGGLTALRLAYLFQLKGLSTIHRVFASASGYSETRRS
jgi:hypothetical protein